MNQAPLISPTPAEGPLKSHILIVGDDADELRAVRDLISADLGPLVCADSDTAGMQLFATLRPAVLIFAFSALDLAQTFYLKLYRQDGRISLTQHQSLLLCKNMEAGKAYALCQDGTFDDYGVNRPLYDPFRLRLSVQQALQRRLEAPPPVPAKAPPSAALRLLDSLPGSPGREAEDSRYRSDAGLKAYRDVYLNGIKAETAAELTTAGEILVVDDDEFYRDLVSGAVGAGGLRAVSVADGESALARLRQSRPQMVLLDYLMPGMDGFAVLRRIKADPALKSIPVVMLTGDSERSVVEECIHAGAAGFIVKPSTPTVILEKIKSLLEARR